MSENKWLDIEGAPRSGYIIGAWKDGKWQAAQLWWDDSVEEWTHATGDHYVKPTHWMPLPEPPTSSPTKEGVNE
jgi:hypothetical protein